MDVLATPWKSDDPVYKLRRLSRWSLKGCDSVRTNIVICRLAGNSHRQVEEK